MSKPLLPEAPVKPHRARAFEFRHLANNQQSKNERKNPMFVLPVYEFDDAPDTAVDFPVGHLAFFNMTNSDEETVIYFQCAVDGETVNFSLPLSDFEALGEYIINESAALQERNANA